MSTPDSNSNSTDPQIEHVETEFTDPVVPTTEATFAATDTGADDGFDRDENGLPIPRAQDADEDPDEPSAGE